MSLDLAPGVSRPVHAVEDLLGYFRSAERGAGPFKVGLEHEKLLFTRADGLPVPYEGERGIGALLAKMQVHGYAPFSEAPGLPTIALQRGVETVSLEPGGQLELSGSPFVTAREAAAENARHLAELKAAADALGLRVVMLGYRPFEDTDSMPWMPKSRYGAMRSSLGSRGPLARDMMLLTATGQVSLDWTSEADCAEKVTVAARLAPLLVALYANSPLRQGVPSGFMSYRSHVWTAVDGARCGYLPFMLDGTFTYRGYAEWALDAPVLFLRRDGKYVVPGVPFRALLAHGYGGAPVTESDWADHLSTLFPEVRIKKVLEVRSADCCGPAMTAALPALWRGLLYDPAARAEALDLLPRLSFSEHLELHALAGREGLRGRFREVPLWRLAREMVEISRRALRRMDPDDAALLAPLAEVANGGVSPAERLLEAHARGASRGELLDLATL
jgi:glutamate--cysteine ligase